jgi:alanyl-tRNA synthetase
VASGVRRVEVVTGLGSLDRFREEHAIVHALEGQLSVPREELLREIGRRFEQLRVAERSLERERVAAVRERLAQKASDPPRIGGVRVLVERVDGLGPQELRELADTLRQKLRSGVVILGRAEADKASVLVAVTPDLTSRVHAGELVRELGPAIGGGGGGRPDLAEAGGKNPAGLDEALRVAVASVGRRVESAG